MRCRLKRNSILGLFYLRRKLDRIDFQNYHGKLQVKNISGDGMALPTVEGEGGGLTKAWFFCFLKGRYTFEEGICYIFGPGHVSYKIGTLTTQL